MKNQEYEIIIMAAGKGTRMKSSLPKVLHTIGGKSLIRLVVDALEPIPHQRIICVVGHGKEQVEAEVQGWGNELAKKISFAHQQQQLGTGDAVRVAFAEIANTKKPIFILSGDTPLVSAKSLEKLWEQQGQTKAQITVAAMKPASPFGYGRIVGANGKLERIIEEKEANSEEKKIEIVNGGLYLVQPDYLREYLPQLQKNSSTGEYYLTDLIHLGAKTKQNLSYVVLDAKELDGVNDFEQLTEASHVLRRKNAKEWIQKGVKILDPRHTYLDLTVTLSEGVVLEPNVYIFGTTTVAEGAHIESGSRLENVTVEKGVRILANSYLENCVVKEGAVVGPMARLRTGTIIREKAKIGNFVELKKTEVGSGSKISHLSYVGDAKIGDETNIGCGFITCNYDGIAKHRTEIGDRVFVGSDVQAVAPITIESDSYVASGSTITKNVKSGDLAIARTRQENKTGYAERILSMKKKKSAEKK